MSATVRKIENIHELVDLLEIVGVNYYAVQAERDEGASDDPEGLATNSEVAQEWGLRIRHDGNEYGARLRLELTLTAGRVTVDAAMEYEADEPFELDQDVAYEYANNVAIMALLPYIRETVMSLTQRVFGDGLLMPVMQRGVISFEPSKK